MTKTKKLTPTDKITSSMQLEINKLTNIINSYKKTMVKYKNQMTIDHNFKEIFRENHPKIYNKIVEKLEQKKS